MQPKRGELVPVGEVIADLPGPIQALRETPPRARRGFTVADQVNQLVGASEADPETGFMARMLVLCSLPRTNPGNQHQYKRVNGPYRLYMQAGPETKLPFEGSAQNRANLYAKPFASHETAVELVLAVEEDVVPPDRADMGQ